MSPEEILGFLFVLGLIVVFLIVQDFLEITTKEDKDEF